MLNKITIIGVPIEFFEKLKKAGFEVELIKIDYWGDFKPCGREEELTDGFYKVEFVWNGTELSLLSDIFNLNDREDFRDD